MCISRFRANFYLCEDFVQTSCAHQRYGSGEFVGGGSKLIPIAICCANDLWCLCCDLITDPTDRSVKNFGR